MAVRYRGDILCQPEVAKPRQDHRTAADSYEVRYFLELSLESRILDYHIISISIITVLLSVSRIRMGYWI